MKFKKILLFLLILLFSKSLFAIEAFKSMGSDIDRGFTYAMFVLVGSILPIIVGIIFIILRHVKKNPWYSFGIYVPALWFAAGHFLAKTWSAQAYGNAHQSGISIGLIIVGAIVLLQALYDFEQVKANRKEKA